MSNIRLLEGEVDDDPYAQIAALKDELRDVRGALTAATREARMAREDGARALAALRKQLSPLYRALQQVFGELDAASVDETEASATTGGRSARELALWADWKSKLPPGCGKIIDALLMHADLNVKQLKVSARMGENSVYQATSRLGQAGLVTKNGGRFSLKAL